MFVMIHELEIATLRVLQLQDCILVKRQELLRLRPSIKFFCLFSHRLKNLLHNNAVLIAEIKWIIEQEKVIGQSLIQMMRIYIIQNKVFLVSAPFFTTVKPGNQKRLKKNYAKTKFTFYYYLFFLYSLTFLYLGMCTMLPWNFLISISAFWNYKFRNVDLNSTSPDMSLDIIRTNHTSIFIPQMAADIPVPLPVIKPTEIQESFPSYLAIGNYKNSVKKIF